MAEHVEENFVDQRIVIDGESFERCRFTGCMIVYRGGELQRIVRCTFDGCSVQLEDAAQRTLGFLHSIYHGFGEFGRRMVEESFDQIRLPPARAEAEPADGGSPPG